MKLEKCICISNKEEYVERFNLWQTYTYEKKKHSKNSPLCYFVDIDEDESVILFEEDFDQHFIDC